MQEKLQAIKNGLILYDPAQLDQPHPHVFEPEHWRTLGQLQSTPGGRGMSWFVGGSAKKPGFWVLRHYCRGGLPGKVLRDTYLWTGNTRSRPFSEWRLLADLYQQGLPVPQPVAARLDRTALWYRGDIMTRRLPAKSWASLLETTSNAEQWQAVGRCIRRFHDAGVWHADLNAHNILLDDQGKVYLIDFDRGRLRPGSHWKADNLARLARSLEKVLDVADWARLKQSHWPLLLNAYGSMDANPDT